MKELTDKRLKELYRAEAKLYALETYGVDNWEGYSIALEEYNKTIEYDKKIEDLFNDICAQLSEHVEQPAGDGCGYGIFPTSEVFETFKIGIEEIIKLKQR